MRVLIDTNILIDICFENGEHYNSSYGALLRLLTNQSICYMTSSCTTDIFYIIKKYCSKEEAKKRIFSLINMCEIVPIREKEICLALESNIDDYEDALVESVAYTNNCDYILTRDNKDFKKSLIKTITPKEINKIYKIQI